MSLQIESARLEDSAVILQLVRALATFERLEHLVVADEADVRRELFGERPLAEALIAREDGAAVGFALFIHNFSTFLGRRGLYLEDLFVVPPARGRGCGKALMRAVAQRAVARGCARFEWSVLDWNRSAIDFYRAIGADVLPDWRICRVTGPALARLGAA